MKEGNPGPFFFVAIFCLQNKNKKKTVRVFHRDLHMSASPDTTLLFVCHLLKIDYYTSKGIINSSL